MKSVDSPQSPYAVLGVEPNATPAEIRRAYRKKVRLLHPDVNPDSDAREKFRAVVESYEILTGSRRMPKETQKPPEEARSNPGPEGNRRRKPSYSRWEKREKFEDILNRQKVRFEDQEEPHPLEVSLREAILGGEVESRLPGVPRVRIPPGARDGDRIRVPNPPRIFAVRLSPDPRFAVDGDHLVHRLRISPWEAVLGARVELTTPSSRIWVTVPAGSPSHRRLRIPNRGLPSKNGDQAGDLLLELEVVSPTALSDGERRAWELLQSTSKFEPRDGQD
jgi:curved DNA-binding protein